VAAEASIMPTSPTAAVVDSPTLTMREARAGRRRLFALVLVVFTVRIS
jgi:hypothetical protein